MSSWATTLKSPSMPSSFFGLHRAKANKKQKGCGSSAFHKDGTPEAEAWVEHQLVKVLAGRSGGEIAKSMRLMAKTRGLDATAAKPVEKAAAYLVKHTRLLHYDRALADGLPIATGVIEGACRYLVQDRMGTHWCALIARRCRGRASPVVGRFRRRIRDLRSCAASAARRAPCRAD